MSILHKNSKLVTCETVYILYYFTHFYINVCVLSSHNRAQKKLSENTVLYRIHTTDISLMVVHR